MHLNILGRCLNSQPTCIYMIYPTFTKLLCILTLTKCTTVSDRHDKYNIKRFTKRKNKFYINRRSTKTVEFVVKTYKTSNTLQ